MAYNFNSRILIGVEHLSPVGSRFKYHVIKLCSGSQGSADADRRAVHLQHRSFLTVNANKRVVLIYYLL